MLGLTHSMSVPAHVTLHFIPGPDDGVWQRLTGLSSAHSSDEDGGLWSHLVGPDGVLLDT